MGEFREELVSLFDGMSIKDRVIWRRYTDGNHFCPGLVIAPDGEPYLYRWYLLGGRDAPATVMFHLQVQSDPERPLHDHPWDTQSVILVGGYDELIQSFPSTDKYGYTHTRFVRKGHVIHRRATEAHRLVLPLEIPYTMTLFTTGPKVREWGFWYPDGWHHNAQHVAMRDGKSVHIKGEE